MQESIGKRIAQRRLAKGITQERLAREMGVSAQAVSKWENDVNYPDVTLLAPLAGLLGITVDELLTGAAKSSPAAETFQEQESSPREQPPDPEPTAAVPASSWLRIRVTGGQEGDNVDVSIPLSVIKFAARVAIAQPAVASAAAREGIDPEAIIHAVERGELGTVVDVTDRDSGERVHIWIA